VCVQFCWPVHCFLCFTTFVGCSCVDYFPAVGDKVVFVASVQFYEYVFHPIGKQFQLQDSINRPKICVGSRAYGVCEAAKCLRYNIWLNNLVGCLEVNTMNCPGGRSVADPGRLGRGFAA